MSPATWTEADLRDLADEALPENIALMRIMLQANDPAALERLESVASQCLFPSGQARIRRLVASVRGSPQAWRTVRRTAAEIPHGADEARSSEQSVARLSQQFDAAARRSPEASVALYSLGDAERLGRATDEIVQWMGAAGLLGADKAVLDIGCGIGRLELAAAEKVARIVGCDISAEMVAMAARRCAGLANVSFRRTGGLDLRECEDESFDTVIAIDVFPYLVQSGGNLAQKHIAESARVLRRNGALAILNYSYRGSAEQDGAELKTAAGRSGLSLVEAGARPFKTWDGAVFRLRKN